MAMKTIRPAGAVSDARHSNNVVALFVLFGTYFSFNMVGRWLRGFLFSGHARNGWPEPSVLTTAYQVFMACVSIAFLTWVFYLVAARFPRLCNRVVVLVLMFVLAAA